jgi:hypothetical protein
MPFECLVCSKGMVAPIGFPHNDVGCTIFQQFQEITKDEGICRDSLFGEGICKIGFYEYRVTGFDAGFPTYE